MAINTCINTAIANLLVPASVFFWFFWFFWFFPALALLALLAFVPPLSVFCFIVITNDNDSVVLLTSVGHWAVAVRGRGKERKRVAGDLPRKRVRVATTHAQQRGNPVPREAKRKHICKGEAGKARLQVNNHAGHALWRGGGRHGRGGDGRVWDGGFMARGTAGGGAGGGGRGRGGGAGW